MGEEIPRGTLGTVRNAALLLELLAEGPAHQQLSDLADRSGMSLPTLHRLLRSLVAAGLVEQDPHTSRYGLGPQLVVLAEQYVTRLPVLTAARPYLAELRNTTKGTVVVAILVGDRVVHVDRVDGEDAGGVFRDASRVHPAVDRAAGRVLLAAADDATWEHATTGLDVGRDDWDTPVHVLEPSVPGEAPEVAAPLRDDRGRVVAALSVIGGRPQFDDDAVAELTAPLLRAASAVSRALGHG